MKKLLKNKFFLTHLQNYTTLFIKMQEFFEKYFEKYEINLDFSQVMKEKEKNRMQIYA